MSSLVYIVLIGAIMIVSIVAIEGVKEYKLKKEQIKADAMVRTEEINARNRLEIEQLMCSSQNKLDNIQISKEAEPFGSERTLRDKIKYR